jgi:hypothetical protein
MCLHCVSCQTPSITEQAEWLIYPVLHPYYKLAYIKMAWGGAEEQAKERAAGNRHAKNWQDEALKIVENTVSI